MKVLRLISLISLATLVLVSSTSFMVGMHFCDQELQNFALFSKADGCHLEKPLPPCHKPASPGCCDDQTIVHQSEDFKVSVKHAYLSPVISVIIDQAPVLISEIIPGEPVSKTGFYKYDSPLRSADLTVEHQVFLI